MKYKFNNNIRVLCEKYDLDRPNADVQRLQETYLQKEKLDKQSYQWLVGFLKCKSQGEAKEYIRNELKKLTMKKDENPEEKKKYKQQLNTLSMWIDDKKLFPTTLMGQQNINAESIKEIQRGLNLSDEKINEINGKPALEWRNQPGNEIKEYTKTLLNDTITHPMAVKRGKHISALKDFDFLSEISLYKEKSKIEKLGTKYLPEHYAVVMTLLRLLNDKGKAYEEFDTYTGSWRDSEKQKKAGTAYNLTEYSEALNQVLDRAVQSKAVQEPKPILGEYQQSLGEKAKEAENDLRKQVNEDTIMAAFNGDTRVEIQENIDKLQRTFNTSDAWSKYGRFNAPRMMDIISMLKTAEDAAGDEILENTMKNNVGINRTRSAYLEEVKKALLKAKETKAIAKVAFSEGKFKTFGQDDIEQLFKDPEAMNINLWKQIVNGEFWKTDLGTFGDLWSIAAYIDDRPSTKLLIITEPRKTELQDFLSQKLAEHKVYEFKNVKFSKANIQTNVQSNTKEKGSVETTNSIYIERLYERIKNIEGLKKISEPTLKAILADGKIEGKELYNALDNLGFPDEYREYEKILQEELNKIINELEKEVNIATEKLPDDIKTVEGVLTILGITDKSKFEKILKKNIGELSPEEAKELSTIIQRSGKQNHALIQQALGILKNRLVIEMLVGDNSASHFRMAAIGNGGLGVVAGIKKGDPKLKSTEGAGRDAGAATYEKRRQIRAIEKDSEALEALKKLGYKPEDLDKPVIAIEIQKKVNTLPDGPEKSALLKYIPTIANITRQQVSAIGTIIRNEPTMAAEYISSITGMSKEEIKANIPAYQYINKHIYKSVEYNQSSFTESIAKMNIGDTRNIRRLVDGGDILGDSYLIEQTNRGVYNIKDASGKAIIEGLTEDQSEEVVDDMVLFVSMGFGDLIPHIRTIRDQVRLRTSRNTKLDGKISKQEQFRIMKPLYEKLFGAQSKALDIHELDRELGKIGHTPEERKRSIREKLKEKNLMRDDSTLSSPDNMISFLKTL